MHQANLRINEAAQKVLGSPTRRSSTNIEKYGNHGGRSRWPSHEAKLAGRAMPGNLVAFTALGAGLHWGAALARI